MAQTNGKLLIVSTTVLLVSLVFLNNLAHGRKLVLTIEPEDKAGPKDNPMIIGGGGFEVSRHKLSSRRMVIMLQAQAVPESTNPGHSPGVGHLAFDSDDFRPTDPGHSPGAGHSAGPDARNGHNHP